MPDDPIQLISASPAFSALATALGAGRRCVATGSVGSSTAFVAAALAERLDRPVVLVVAHTDDADEIDAELTDARGPGFAAALPAMEVAPGESGVNIEQLAERLRVARLLTGDEGNRPRVLVASIAALMQPIPEAGALDALIRSVRTGQSIEPSALIAWLGDAGYRRVEAVEEPGQVAVRGGIVDIYPPPTGELAAPVRLDFFGDEVEAIFEIDPDTMGSDRRLDAVDLVAVDPTLISQASEGPNPLELVDARAIALIHETMEVVEQGRGYFERIIDQRGIAGPPRVLALLAERFHALAEINQFSAGATDADTRIDLPVRALPAFEQDTSEAFGELGGIALCARTLLCCRNDAEGKRAGELLGEHAPGVSIETVVRYVHRGFVWDEAGTVGSESRPTQDGSDVGSESRPTQDGSDVGSESRPTQERSIGFAFVPYHELLGRYDTLRSTRRLRAGRAMDTFLDFAPGEFVVHAEHGIAQFVELTTMKPGGTKNRLAPPEPEEYLTLAFAGSSKLHVPCAQIDLVQKYVGGFSGKPKLSSIGSRKWKNAKAKVVESVRDLAGEMLRVRAAREAMAGIRYPADTPWQLEFEGEFPYDETEDQLAALVEIKKDMSSPRPMDRLLCGDVGFGKTELAIRAAFKACEFGKQAAVLVPTTVLAEQHERVFRARFADYPFKVASLSRFKTGAEIKQTLRDLRDGRIDVVVGTHRLLSKDVRYADLGLVVIDEEQRFGVEHKESLLRLRMTVDVLTLSATPIPRTLHMSMLGLRDISSLTTPPADRRAIVTEVIPYNAARIRQSIERELSREGQVYFVHNRVYNIRSVADDVRQLVPDARVVFGHGQMPPRELEAVMLKFMRRQADVLVSTTIIESGIDNPHANTMIINDADRFGLADLHQLRGRVGRSKHRAYCYFLLPETRPVKPVAQKRLKAIEQFSMLGAGFKIAMRDLEIRGAGNLLGAEQSGHIAAVGYDMYCSLLERAVEQLNDPEAPEPIEHLAIDIGISGTIPRAYIPSDMRRLEAYRRIATAGSDGELDKVVDDLTSAYGKPPKATGRLIDIARIRVAARALGVRTIALRGKRIVLMAPDPGPIAQRFGDGPGAVSVVSPELAQTKSRSPLGTPLAEVYWTPPASYLDAGSLLRILPRRLAAAQGERGSKPLATSRTG